VQLDSRLSRAYVGSGLGLTLVYRMTDLHGGGVSVESVPGAGSRFTVTLPWLPAGATPSGTPESGRIEKALLFQTALDPLGELAASLSELGIWAMPHLCGPGAFETVVSVQPPLVVLEVDHASECGWQLLRQLKEDARTRPIPVIAVTTGDAAPVAGELGAAEVVLKPATRDRLRSAISGAGLARWGRTGRTGLLAAGTSASAGPLILIADDNEMRLLAQSRLLQSLGYRSTIARNGQEVLDRAREEQPALILLDVHLPVLGGAALIRRLRNQPQTTSAPILAINTLALAAERERCLCAGATDYFYRPVSAPQLARAISVYTASARERTA
jgi:CheY-like chemotaxis protein